MITCIRTDSNNKDFQALVKDLDIELKIRDGADHSFYNQFNKIDSIKNAVVAYKENTPVACGAFKHYDEKTMEIKRMFVPFKYRGQGHASIVLAELEKWCQELKVQRCILETGINQPEAINLYYKNNYTLIPNFGQYENVTTSRCFDKILQLILEQ